jgi:hypothetical protein
VSVTFAESERAATETAVHVEATTARVIMVEVEERKGEGRGRAFVVENVVVVRPGFEL